MLLSTYNIMRSDVKLLLILEGKGRKEKGRERESVEVDLSRYLMFTAGQRSLDRQAGQDEKDRAGNKGSGNLWGRAGSGEAGRKRHT